MRRMSARGTVLAALTVLLCVGCASMSEIRPLAVSIPVGESATFERLQAVARSRGYTPVEVNPYAGTFVIDAQRRARPSEIVRFRVECSRDGFAMVLPIGPRVDRRGSVYHLPSAVRDEYVDLVVAFTQVLHPGRDEATP